MDTERFPNGQEGARSPAQMAMRALSFMFLGRVAGQALVASGQTRRLPPMSEWQSGLLPYPLLFLSQCGILALQRAINRDIRSGTGRLGGIDLRTAQRVRRLSILYFTGNAGRYVIGRYRNPDRKWY